MKKIISIIIKTSLILICLLAAACATTSNPTNSTAKKILSKNVFHCARAVNTQYSVKNKGGLLKKDPAWMPTRVYDDGVSVYVYMTVADGSLPILLILDEKNQPVAYRYQANKHYYRVDCLFKKALLIKKDGKKEEKVLITKK